MKKALCLLLLMLLFVILSVSCTNPLTNHHLTAAQKVVRVSAGIAASKGDLIAGRTIKVGTVTTWNNAHSLYVTYATQNGWVLSETHLAIASSVNEIPQTKKGNPIPGQFANKTVHDLPLSECTYTIPLEGAEYSVGKTLYLAAHAEVQKVDATGAVIQAEGAWAAGEVEQKFAGKNWATYFTFEIESSSLLVAINEELASHNLGMRVVPIIPPGSKGVYLNMTLTAYALSETEVTQGDFHNLMEFNPSHFIGDSTLPVETVTFYEAALFCNALSVLCGLLPVYDTTSWAADFTKNGFYIPTDAQWGYAAGGPNHYDYSFGNTWEPLEYIWGTTATAPVKSKPANGFGLYNMIGNVWEWCNDFSWGDYPYVGQTDPTGPVSGESRVGRGGSWYDIYLPYLCSDSRGNAGYPTPGDWRLGFRVAVGGFGLWN